MSGPSTNQKNGIRHSIHLKVEKYFVYFSSYGLLEIILKL